MISEYYKLIKRNVERRFSDILKSAELIQGTAGRVRKLRLYLIDNTFVDIWYSSDGSQLNVTESFLSDDSENAVEEFLRLVRERMVAEQIDTKKDR